MNGITRLFFGFCAVAFLVETAAAQGGVMYQCVDEDGNKTFSNVKLTDKDIKCVAMELGPAVSGSVASVPPPKATPAPGKASPRSFPKVEENVQKERDNDRRRILESELEVERRDLEQAKKDLAAQENIRNGNERNYQRVLDRLEPFRDKAALHERNIDAIEKELAKLR
jgi:hypothetical protein